jgi:hypothetical protein
MIHFPHSSLKQAAFAANALAPVRQASLRDVLWNRPVFKAPVLSNPPLTPEPLPFKAARVTQRAR